MSLLGLPRPAPVGTARYTVARTWPDRREAAVRRMPLAASPPSWAVFRLVPGGWAQFTVWMSAGDWLAWSGDTSPSAFDPAVALPILWPAVPAVVALLDTVETIA